MTVLLRLLLTMLIACVPVGAAAQATLVADWTNLGAGNLQAVPSGTSLAVGPNSVTVTTRVNTDGDTNDGSFVPFASTGMLAYSTGQIGSQTGPLLYSMDHSVFDEGDYFETTFTLATAVQSLAFTVANVDRQFTSVNKHDAVVIEYDTGSGVWQNLRPLTAAYTLGSRVGTVTVNGQLGFAGTSTASSDTDIESDIRVAFGAVVTVKRIRIRYLFGQDRPTRDPSGASQYIGLSDLTWTQTGVAASDLSLGGSVSPASPAAGAAASYTVTIANAGPHAATGVVVASPLPAGFRHVSSSATSGSYNPATGWWSGIAVGSGASQTLTISGIVDASAGATVATVAEVYSSPNYDLDSTPNNSSAIEDDRAALSFTVAGSRTAGTAPALICPAGSSLFDWDLVAWTAGSLANNYTLTNIGAIDFAVSSTGNWVNNVTYGGQSPALSNALNGGVVGTQRSLHQYLDFNTQAETATTVITLATAVPGAQFTIFDVDFNAGQFADRLTVTGSFGGVAVLPTLTNGIVNYVVGNTAIGDGGAANTAADGNVTVTFAQPVDTITIAYGNHTSAPLDPGGQAISIWDLTFCNPVAVLGVTKVSTLISDPTNGTTNPRAIPGAVMEYCILVQNPGSGTATNVVGTDTIPAALTYMAGSITSGSTCGGSTTAEDDDAAGADESDPFGASVSGTVLTATAATLGPGAGFALKFRTTIK